MNISKDARERRLAGAEQRVLDALEKIERAQHTMSAACADLSAIIGCVPHWRRCARLSDRCHEAWRMLAYADRGCWMLDRDPGKDLRPEALIV